MPRKSTSDYPDDWDDIARAVKDESGWTCVRCGHPHDPDNGYCLTVHHLDLSPANCRWWNLVALCQRCHLTIQSKVDMQRMWMFEHSPWFRPYVAGRYAWLRKLPDDRESVERNMDDLPRGARFYRMYTKRSSFIM